MLNVQDSLSPHKDKCLSFKKVLLPWCRVLAWKRVLAGSRGQVGVTLLTLTSPRCGQMSQQWVFFKAPTD